ncbi:hypothetical protein V8G54_019645, partial [Vigna mungo]
MILSLPTTHYFVTSYTSHVHLYQLFQTLSSTFLYIWLSTVKARYVQPSRIFKSKLLLIMCITQAFPIPYCIYLYPLPLFHSLLTIHYFQFSRINHRYYTFS